MGPKSILSANDKSPEESLQVFPESVDVLSFGQGLHESLPVTNKSGTLVPCKYSTDQKGGLFAMVLEGMTGSRIANLEKNCNRNPVAYMHYLDQEDQYDTPGNLMESPCENSTPSIPRTDTWSASTSYSPMHTSQQPNSLEQSDLYTSIKPANLFARNACSNSFSDDEDGTLSGADIPPPVPPRTHLSKRPTQPIVENSSAYHPATELFQQNVTPGQSSDSNLQPLPISRLHTAPKLLDSCDFGSFDPYVRMESVLGRERKAKESPPVPRIQQFLQSEKPPPIPPRASNRNK